MTKEDIKQICQIYDNFRSERDAAIIAYNSDDTFWEHILATYNLSQPSLPSNLDEAAIQFAQRGYSPFDDPYEASKAFENDVNCFKAGAEWMEGQDKEKIEQAFFSGYNECEDRMKKEFEKRAMAGEVNNTGYPTTIQLHTFDSSLKNGDKVNIIIMKQ